MALQFGRAPARGARRGVSVSGMVVLVLTAVYQIAVVGAANTVALDLLPPSVEPSEVGGIDPPRSRNRCTSGPIRRT